MEKSFSMFENRRQIVEDNLELLLELDRILYDPAGASVCDGTPRADDAADRPRAGGDRVFDGADGAG